MKQKGFTLVELLAVIVILAIILAIAVPGISGIIKSSTMKSMESDAKLVLKAIDLKKLGTDSFDPVEVDQGSIETLLGISNDKYNKLNVIVHEGKVYISIEGKGKWQGFSACGSYHNIIVTEGTCIVDYENPDIKLNGDNPMSIYLGDTYEEPGAVVTDNSGETIEAVITGTVDSNALGDYVITYTATDSSGNTFTITRTVSVVYAPEIFGYTGSAQTFTAPVNGTYKLEVWGAQGGAGNRPGGAGGYATGNIELTANQTLYVYVGLQGRTNGTAAYNGGGTAASGAGGGGGATHIATVNGVLNSLRTTNPSAILIVAGAGGGSGLGTTNTNGTGGYGGGATGGTGGLSNYYIESATITGGGGGTQSAGGAKSTYSNYSPSDGGPGYGGNGGGDASKNLGGGGGGSGYYGGGGGTSKLYTGETPNKTFASAGGGGSSYIGGVTNGQTIAGNTNMPNPNGATADETMVGKTGNGYARITFVSP